MDIIKEYLTKIEGIGEDYGDKILDEYTEFYELKSDLFDKDVDVSEKTGVPNDVIDKLKTDLGKVERLQRLNEMGDSIVDEKIDKLDGKVKKLNHHETDEGNEDIKTHLENLLQKLKENPDVWIDEQIEDIERGL